jgi:hypothetical protein
MITKNSNTYYITRPDCIISVPVGINGEPDFTKFTGQTLAILEAEYKKQKGSIKIIPDPISIPIVANPDWNTLQAHLLAGDLNSIFARLTLAAIDSNSLSTARGDVTDSILTVRVEAALASAIQLLEFVGWVFTPKEVILWNTKVTELGFSALVRL